MDPDCPWVSGYVDYEWRHLRPLLAAYDIDPGGREVLEFGCNVGASGIVMAKLGARVTGVDVDPGAVEVANANIALNRVEDRARAMYVADTRAMPFADEAFDLVIANSVLEYVPQPFLASVMAEIHRVLRPGGLMLICGTSSRLSPREMHSRAWLVNYIPRIADRLTGRTPVRGLAPWDLRRAIAGRFVPEKADGWLGARKAVHGRVSLPVRLVDRLAGIAGIAPGWISPSMELLLRRI